MKRPKQENNNAESGTEVLEDGEPGTRTKDRKRNVFVENRELSADPMSGMSKGVPEDVGCDANENGQHDQAKAGRRVD